MFWRGRPYPAPQCSQCNCCWRGSPVLLRTARPHHTRWPSRMHSLQITCELLVSSYYIQHPRQQSNCIPGSILSFLSDGSRVTVGAEYTGFTLHQACKLSCILTIEHCNWLVHARGTSQREIVLTNEACAMWPLLQDTSSTQADGSGVACALPRHNRPCDTTPGPLRCSVTISLLLTLS